MKTYDLRKRSLPSVINFNSGYTALLTMASLRCVLNAGLSDICGRIAQDHEELQSQKDLTADGTVSRAGNKVMQIKTGRRAMRVCIRRDRRFLLTGQRRITTTVMMMI